MDSMDYWRLCDELNVIQAALLLVGEDPASCEDYIEGWRIEKRPEGYEAAKMAISRGLAAGSIIGNIRPRLTPVDPDVFPSDLPGIRPVSREIEGTIDLRESTVIVESLRKWLAGKGFSGGFFLPDGLQPTDYLNPSHPRYAAKLAAAIKAWQSFKEDESNDGKTPKQALMIWLRLNAAKFGLADEDGKPNETGIEEVAKVANWQTKGGAPKTPS